MRTINQISRRCKFWVYNFRRWFDAAESEKYKALSTEAFKKAAMANPNNPLLYVMSGTKLISDGQKEEDFRKIYAGKILLETAKEKFDQSTVTRSMTTHWNFGVAPLLILFWIMQKGLVFVWKYLRARIWYRVLLWSLTTKQRFPSPAELFATNYFAEIENDSCGIYATKIENKKVAIDLDSVSDVVYVRQLLNN